MLELGRGATSGSYNVRAFVVSAVSGWFYSQANVLLIDSIGQCSCHVLMTRTLTYLTHTLCGFQLVDFDSLLSHYDDRLTRSLNKRYLEQEWGFSKLTHCSSQMPRDIPPVDPAFRQRQASIPLNDVG